MMKEFHFTLRLTDITDFTDDQVDAYLWQGATTRP